MPPAPTDVKAPCHTARPSVSGKCEWPEIPTAFGQAESAAEEAPSSCPPGVGAVAGVLRMGVLDVEEGLFRIERVAVGGEPVGDAREGAPAVSGRVVGRPGVPVRADEAVAPHGLLEEGRILLAERPAPPAAHVKADGMAEQFRFFGMDGGRVAAVAVALPVVVAGDEDALDAAAVRQPVVRDLVGKPSLPKNMVFPSNMLIQ